MAERTIGKNIHGQPIFYGSAADLAAKAAVIDALAEFWLPDGSRYQSNGAGGWNQTHGAGGVPLVTEANPKSIRASQQQWVIGDSSAYTTVVNGTISAAIDLTKIDRSSASIFFDLNATATSFQLDVGLSYDGTNIVYTVSNPLGGALAASNKYVLPLDNANLRYAPYIFLVASGTVGSPAAKAFLAGQKVEV